MDELATSLIMLAVGVVVICLYLTGCYLIDMQMCHAKAISFNHTFGLWQGCMIEVKEGFWIPLESYRSE